MSMLEFLKCNMIINPYLVQMVHFNEDFDYNYDDSDILFGIVLFDNGEILEMYFKCNLEADCVKNCINCRKYFYTAENIKSLFCKDKLVKD